MNEIKHVVISRAKFNDKEIRDKYYKVAKNILVPALKSQTEKNFDWILFINEEDVEYTKDYFEMDFIPICNIPNLVDEIKGNKKHTNWLTKYMIENQYNIQTRHDIDDWMSPYYIQEIQNIYKEKIKEYDKFLIHADPNLKNKKNEIINYNDTRTSMFLSLCQKECNKHVFIQPHAQMWKEIPKVFKMSKGYVKWTDHGDNITHKHKEYNILFGKKRKRRNKGK